MLAAVAQSKRPGIRPPRRKGELIFSRAFMPTTAVVFSSVATILAARKGPLLTSQDSSGSVFVCTVREKRASPDREHETTCHQILLILPTTIEENGTQYL